MHGFWFHSIGGQFSVSGRYRAFFSPSILAHSAAAIRFSRMWNARCERASNAKSSHPHSQLLIVVVILRTSVILNQADKYMIYDICISLARNAVALL